MAEELVREQRGETKEVQEGGEVLEGKIEERNEGVGKVRCLDGKGEGEERKEGGKGGTAQDKRRAAHRRRMVLAFGGGV
jgi:spermidine synthase